MPASVSDVRLYRTARNKRLLESFGLLLGDRAFYNEEGIAVPLLHGDKKPPGGEMT